MLLYGGVLVLHYQEEYSPLQALPSAESEAQRLLRFMMSYHYQCNSTLHSSNMSDWALCVEENVGINPDPSITKMVYSIGPLPDYSFEMMLSRNLSFQQVVFVNGPSSVLVSPLLLQLPNTTVYHAIIVPNDPADFGRNSYDMQTVNSVMSTLGHRHVDVLKIESLQDISRSYEVLYFMVKDGLLARFRQLHIMMEIDHIYDDYLYGWYKTLYTIFHSAGFRLYHTSASSPLCLQVTLMESCHYFMSWVQNPGPQTFVMYPPAIDGSVELEGQRLESFLETPDEVSDDDVIPVEISTSSTVRLSRQLVMTGNDKCDIYVFKYKNMSGKVQKEVSALHIKCAVSVLSPRRHMDSDIYDFSFFDVSNSLGAGESITLEELTAQLLTAKHQTYFILVDLGPNSWQLLTELLNSGALQRVNQLLLEAPIFLTPSSINRQPAVVLRYRYSELQRLLAFKFMLLEARTLSQSSLKFRSSTDLWHLNFVRK